MKITINGAVFSDELQEIMDMVKFYQTTDGINFYRHNRIAEEEETYIQEVQIDGDCLKASLKVLGDGEDINELTFDIKGDKDESKQ